MRCFIAIDLPEEARKEIARIQAKINSEVEMKANWVKPELLHLTLRFLGEINDFRVNQIKELLKGQSGQNIQSNQSLSGLGGLSGLSFEARLNGLGTFPSESFIRVLWIGLEPREKFKALHELIDRQLEKIKIKPDKQFEAHVTLARIKWLKDKREFLEKIKKIKPEPISFKIDEIKLKKSTLTRDGPIYEDIITIKL